MSTTTKTVLFVGHKQSGKTLCRLLLCDRSIHDGYISTIGLDMSFYKRTQMLLEISGDPRFSFMLTNEHVRKYNIDKILLFVDDTQKKYPINLIREKCINSVRNYNEIKKYLVHTWPVEHKQIHFDDFKDVDVNIKDYDEIKRVFSALLEEEEENKKELHYIDDTVTYYNYYYNNKIPQQCCLLL